MGNETTKWYNTKILVGFTTKRGQAWHFNAAAQGEEPNHYDLAIPVADVSRRLFDWAPVEGSVVTVYVDKDGNRQTIADADRKTIVRPAGTFGPEDDGAILGLFKDGYQIHSYQEWLVNSVSTILGDTLQIGSAGLLKGGAVAWVSVEVPENILTPEGVEFRPNLLATTSLDGSLSTTYKRVVTNVVCDNTHGAALGEKGQAVKVKHSRYSNLKLDDARDALAIIHETADDFAAEVAGLCSTPVSAKQWGAFLDILAPIGKDAGRAQTIAINKQDALKALYLNDNRVSPWAGTAWGVVQAVNTWEHHGKTVKGSDRNSRNVLRKITGDFDSLDSETFATLNKVLVNV
jgi:phage/plasmid-like protein (TIGR03299 family)